MLVDMLLMLSGWRHQVMLLVEKCGGDVVVPVARTRCVVQRKCRQRVRTTFNTHLSSTEYASVVADPWMGWNKGMHLLPLICPWKIPPLQGQIVTTISDFYSKCIKQEAFEKRWAHSPLRAAARPFSRCRYRYCGALPAHRCPQRRQRRQRQRVTEGTAMAPWNGPKKHVVGYAYSDPPDTLRGDASRQERVGKRGQASDSRVREEAGITPPTATITGSATASLQYWQDRTRRRAIPQVTACVDLRCLALCYGAECGVNVQDLRATQVCVYRERARA